MTDEPRVTFSFSGDIGSAEDLSRIIQRNPPIFKLTLRGRLRLIKRALTFHAS